MGKEGESMAGIKDVAKLAGVGVGTVSRMINESGYVSIDTRAKIEAAMKELNYTPNELALLLTSMNAKTFIVGLAGFLSAYNQDLGPMCAGAFLFSFPVMILSMFAQRYIVQGMTAGAVKG